MAAENPVVFAEIGNPKRVTQLTENTSTTGAYFLTEKAGEPEAKKTAYATVENAVKAKLQGEYLKKLSPTPSDTKTMSEKLEVAEFKKRDDEIVKLGRDLNSRPKSQEFDMTDKFEQGTIDDPIGDVDSSIRVRFINKESVFQKFNCTIKEGFLFSIHYYDVNGVYISNTSFVSSITNKHHVGLVRVVLKRSNDGNITPSDVTSTGFKMTRADVIAADVEDLNSVYSFSYGIYNSLDKTEVLQINWETNSYYNADGVKEAYTGSSKWASARIDISNISGIYTSNFNCAESLSAKTIIVDNNGGKRYLYNNGADLDFTINKNDATILLSNDYTSFPIENTYLSTKQFKKIKNIESIVGVDKLKDKRLSVIGDSISTFAPISPTNWSPRYPSGDVTLQEHTYWGMLAKNDGMVIDTISAWGGSMIAKELSSGQMDISMCDDSRLTALGNPDVILLFGGTNDFGYKNRWRQLGDFDFGNKNPDLFKFKAALQYTVEQLQKLHPKAQLCILTPLQRARYKEFETDYPNTCDYPAKNGIGLWQYQYRDALIEIANVYGITIIDTNKCGITYYNSNNNTSASGGINLYTQDGVHPNRAGMSLLYNYIRSILLSIF